MRKSDRTDGVSRTMLDFFSGLNESEREELTDALRDPNTFIAEDLDDLLAILKHLEAEREGLTKPTGH